MAEYTRNTGTGSKGTGGTGGTGYSDHTRGNSYEPRSSAALWIVGIVVVVGALAIWIARNTVDDTDRMQSRPGMDQTATDQDLDRTGNGAPILERSDDQDVRGLDEGHFGDDAGDRNIQNSTIGAQQGTGTIDGRTTEDGRYEDPAATDRSSTVSGSSGTFPSSASDPAAGAENSPTGTGSTGTGTTDAGSGAGTGTGTQGTGTTQPTP